MSGGATGGVQNYKGVMLCNRPADDAPPTVNPAVEAPRFRPGGLASEPIGLNPAKENLVSNMLAVHVEPNHSHHRNRDGGWDRLHMLGAGCGVQAPAPGTRPMRRGRNALPPLAGGCQAVGC